MKFFCKWLSKGFVLGLSKGFTLIELLIVVAILGVLAAGILVIIDPIDKINQANDSRVQNDVSAIGRASESYAITHNGYYPAVFFPASDLVVSGELKRMPLPPSGYSTWLNNYWVDNVPSGCTAGTTCTGISVGGQLKSKRYTKEGLKFWRYESSSGKSCAVTVLNTATTC